MAPAVYTANRQDAGVGMLTFYVRTAGGFACLEGNQRKLRLSGASIRWAVLGSNQ